MTAQILSTLSDQFRLGLVAAGYQAGEIFELTAISKPDGRLDDYRIEHVPEQLESAVAWLMRQDDALVATRAAGAATSGGLHLGSNPLLSLDGGRAKDSDVSVVRLLLVDVDPIDTSPEARSAAADQALALYELLQEKLVVRPALVDSGRGRQLWLRHAAIDPTATDLLDLRRRLVHLLAARFDGPLAKIDRSTHNASRLMRLPGTVNLRTGDRASVLDPGDGKVMTIAQLEQLVRDLDEATPSPVLSTRALAPSLSSKAVAVEGMAGGGRSRHGDRLTELGALLGSLPSTSTTWASFAALAVRADAVEQARGVVPSEHVVAFDAGVAGVADGVKYPPVTKNEELLKRIKKALNMLVVPDTAAGAALYVDRIVHLKRPLSQGGTFELSIKSLRGSCLVRGLEGADLDNYRTIRARALENGLALPELKGKAVEAWKEAVLEAFEQRREVVDLPEASEIEVVIAESIRRVVGSRPKAETHKDLDQGHVFWEGGFAAMTPRNLVHAVIQDLEDDAVGRREILAVAMAMGGVQVRQSREAGDRRDVIRIPVSEVTAVEPVVDEALEAAQPPADAGATVQELASETELDW